MSEKTTSGQLEDAATWRSEVALELPFDQYQRYATAARVVEGLGGVRDKTVLDVGGAPGFMEVFFPGAKVAIVDRYGSHGGNFIVADGARLPFDDDAFDVVLSLDVLEHIYPQFREPFLAELRRVARDYVVLSAPHATDGVQMAEAALQSFVTARFGEVFGTLQEHADNGLPRIEDTLTGLGAGGWHAARLPSGYLPRWLLGMVFHHELLAVGLPELPQLHRFYNERQSLLDNVEPSYRQVVVASGSRSQAELEALVDGLRGPGENPDAMVTLGAIGAAILGARLRGAGEVATLDQEAARLREELSTARTVIADRDAHLIALRQQLGSTEHELAKLREAALQGGRRAVRKEIRQQKGRA